MDALEWCIKQQGASLVEHYLDDYINMGPPALEQCQSDLQTLKKVCSELGILLAQK